MFVTLTFNQNADSNDINIVAKTIESIISVITAADPATLQVDPSIVSGLTVTDAGPTTWYAGSGRRRGPEGDDLPDTDPVQVGDYWIIRNSDYPDQQRLLFAQIVENPSEQGWPTKYQILIGGYPFATTNRFLVESRPLDPLKIVTGEDYIAFMSRRDFSRIVHI